MDAARATAIPLSVTEPAQRAAVAALEHEAELLERVALLNERREAIWAGITAQGWASPRPHGNFVWLPTGVESARAADILEARGIIARPLGDGVRVSVGEAESVETLLAATAELVGIL